MVAVRLRATSGVQFRPFDGVMVAHHPRTRATAAPWAPTAIHRLDVARHPTATRARTRIAPAIKRRAGSPATNHMAREHQAPLNRMATPRRARPIHRATARGLILWASRHGRPAARPAGDGPA